LKKRSKKTSVNLDHGRDIMNAPGPAEKSLFASFSSEKEAFAQEASHVGSEIFVAA
jgi:hypothetical protein